MARDRTDEPPLYLTTREVAELLRVKERKVYDLAAAGEIPHRRITGKLLFPRAELMDWAGVGSGALAARPMVLAGSHDPLLEWAVRESGSGLATILNGSVDGLQRFVDREAAIAGIHFRDPNGWNIQAVEDWRLVGCVLLTWAVRARGLILSRRVYDRVRSVADLKGMRVAFRQPGAAAAALFEDMLWQEGIDREAAIAGIHFRDPNGWNIQAVEDWRLVGCVLLTWAVRARGLILSRRVYDRVRSVADLKGMRVAFRQPGAAAAALFEDMLWQEGMTTEDVVPLATPAWTESEAAAAVASGEADAALGIEAMARQFHLPFRPLELESFDLVVDRRAYFTEPVRTLLDFSRGEAMKKKAKSMGGYEFFNTGAVRWLSP